MALQKRCHAFTGSGVSVRQTTNLVVRGLGRAFLCLSVCLPVCRNRRTGYGGVICW